LLILAGVAWVFEKQKAEVAGKFGLALESIAGTAAPFLSGDELDEIHGNQDVPGPAFQHLRASLERIRRDNDLAPDQIYVLRRASAGSEMFSFVVMLQEKTFVGDEYHPPPRVQRLYSWVESKVDTVRTPLYKDVHGTFISGIAPIVRKDGTVAGLLQVD